MKIAIVSAGVLPVPAVNGGAVETLIDVFLKENEKSCTPISIDVYSISPKQNINNSDSNVNYFYYRNWILDLFQHNSLLKLIYSKLVTKYTILDIFLNFVVTNIKNKKYDCIVVENRPNFIHRIACNTKSKIVLHMHNEHINECSINYSNLKVDCFRILTVSNYIKNKIVAKYPELSEKTTVLYNGIDIDKFDAFKYRKQYNLIREKVGIEERDFVICFVGRVMKDKGTLELIKAFNKVVQCRKDVKLLIIGSNWFGTNSKNSYMNEVEKVARINSKSIIFTGYIDNKVVAQYESIANVIVIPSMWDDPLPLVVIEAEALGLPIITTNSGGIPEMCSSDEGIVHERDKNIINNLTKSIIEVMDNPETYVEKGKNGRKNVEKKFTTSIYYEKFISLIKE